MLKSLNAEHNPTTAPEVAEISNECDSPYWSDSGRHEGILSVGSLISKNDNFQQYNVYIKLRAESNNL